MAEPHLLVLSAMIRPCNSYPSLVMIPSTHASFMDHCMFTSPSTFEGYPCSYAVDTFIKDTWCPVSFRESRMPCNSFKGTHPTPLSGVSSFLFCFTTLTCNCSYSKRVRYPKLHSEVYLHRDCPCGYFTFTIRSTSIVCLIPHLMAMQPLLPNWTLILLFFVQVSI